jgi:hypothetical protein
MSSIALNNAVHNVTGSVAKMQDAQSKLEQKIELLTRRLDEKVEVVKDETEKNELIRLLASAERAASSAQLAQQRAEKSASDASQSASVAKIALEAFKAKKAAE